MTGSSCAAVVSSVKAAPASCDGDGPDMSTAVGRSAAPAPRSPAPPSRPAATTPSAAVASLPAPADCATSSCCRCSVLAAEESAAAARKTSSGFTISSVCTAGAPGAPSVASRGDANAMRNGISLRRRRRGTSLSLSHAASAGEREQMPETRVPSSSAPGDLRGEDGVRPAAGVRPLRRRHLHLAPWHPHPPPVRPRRRPLRKPRGAPRLGAAAPPRAGQRAVPRRGPRPPASERRKVHGARHHAAGRRVQQRRQRLHGADLGERHHHVRRRRRRVAVPLRAAAVPLRAAVAVPRRTAHRGATVQDAAGGGGGRRRVVRPALGRERPARCGVRPCCGGGGSPGLGAGGAWVEAGGPCEGVAAERGAGAGGARR